MPHSLTDATALFAKFVTSTAPHDRAVILHDSDADGMAAGVVLARALARMGYPHGQRILPDRNRSVWTAPVRERLLKAGPSRLYVLDLGVRAEPVLPDVPTCYIDHHAVDDDELPVAGLVLTSYRWARSPNTSVLTWQLCHALVDMTAHGWVAALGAIGDLNRDWTMPPLDVVRRTTRLAPLREIVSLINAARRVSLELADQAASLVAACDDPGQFLASAGVTPLREAQAAVQRALDEAKRSAPTFSGPVALVRMRSPYQIHPLIAQIWRTRLKKSIVVAANEQYRPGFVSFSVRGPQGVNVRAFLKSVPLPPGEGEYARGHDAASGGSLPIQRWNDFLRLLGFPPAAFARETDGL